MSSIFEDTPLIPEIVAESVCEEMRETLDRFQFDTRPELALCERAERHYSENKSFSRKIRGRNGREFLYAFMRHWLAGMLLKAGAQRGEIPTNFR